MKKLLIVVSMFCSLVANAQEGRWKGELNLPGTKLPIVFNFSSEGCTMDSPSQGAVGIKTDWTRSEEDSKARRLRACSSKWGCLFR